MRLKRFVKITGAPDKLSDRTLVELRLENYLGIRPNTSLYPPDSGVFIPLQLLGLTNAAVHCHLGICDTNN